MTMPQPPPRTPILERILQEAHNAVQNDQTFLAVFDLDSTLFDLTLRVTNIIDEFIADEKNRELYPAECKLIESMQILRTDWGVNEALARVGVTAESHPQFFQAVMDHWSFHFFSDRFLHHDEPLPGAVEFVRALREIGAHVMYLTGRDVPRMLRGTEESLRAWNFPLGGESAKLVLKPAAGLDDASFKVTILKESERKYGRVWLFENEPVNLNLVAKHCPSIGLVFIETVHSGIESVSPNLARVPHFEVSIEAFKQFGIEHRD